MVHAEPKERMLWPIRIGLAGVWIGIVVLLALEYGRVRVQARENLLQRARDISETIGVISRSSRIGVIREERLTAALQELVRGDLLTSVLLVNARGERVVSAGPASHAEPEIPRTGVRWEKDRVIITNIVDLGGGDVTGENPQRNPTIVIPSGEEENRLRPPFPPQRGDGPSSFTMSIATMSATVTTTTTLFQREIREPREAREQRPPGTGGPEPRDRDGERDRNGRRSFGRPPWISEADFKDLIERRGVHGFVLTLNTDGLNRELARELRMRVLFALVALLAVTGIGAAVSSWNRSTRLLLGLVRSQQQNEHLKEMNLAAAGLAHETRNPLNLIRGLAQTISQQDEAPADTRARAHQIVEELDMVTYRLNEFIRYSKPQQPRIAPVDARAVADNVSHALAADIEGRDVAIRNECAAGFVEADEMLLRQLLFNLLLNAVHAVRDPGIIAVRTTAQPDRSIVLVVEDNGPGVEPDLRDEIFRPYVTTSAAGSGLGLAVVRQICNAHGWRIACDASPLGGARFAITGIHAAARSEPRT